MKHFSKFLATLLTIAAIVFVFLPNFAAAQGTNPPPASTGNYVKDFTPVSGQGLTLSVQLTVTATNEFNSDPEALQVWADGIMDAVAKDMGKNLVRMNPKIPVERKAFIAAVHEVSREYMKEKGIEGVRVSSTAFAPHKAPITLKKGKKVDPDAPPPVFTPGPLPVPPTR